MKRRALLLTAISVIAACIIWIGSCPAIADSYSYKFSYNTGSTNEVYTHLDIATGINASSGFDGELAWPEQIPPSVVVGIYKMNGTSGWDGTSGFYGADIREDVPEGGIITFDDIYLWATPGTEIQDLHLFLKDRPVLDGVNLALSLIAVPDGVTYSGPTEWGSETTEIVLPFYSTDDGTTGYRFQATITAVPEPSSLIALTGALLSSGVCAMRRRRSR